MISTLEYAAEANAASLQNYPKCICKSDQHKVHVLKDNGPLCGGGKGGARVAAWQTDIGPINCGACLAIIERSKE